MWGKTQAIIFQYRNIGWKRQRCRIDVLKDLFSAENYDIAVLVDKWDYDYIVSLNNQMRIREKGFILTGSLGLYGFVFVDFGDSHLISDLNGER